MSSIKELLDKGLIDERIAQNIFESTHDLYTFYKRFVAMGYNPKVEAPHIKELADNLQSIEEGKLNRLCVAMPPRHSKSSMVTLAFPLWLIFHNPNTKILIINAESSLSENFGIRLRELIKKYGGFFNVYLSDVKFSSTHLMFCDANGNLYNGSIRLTGSNGSITGQDADYLLLDDIYKGFLDITPTLLSKKIEWFKTMIMQRLEPHSKLIILHTRWHSEDLQGYLKENHYQDYKFIEYPSIKSDGLPLWKERYSVEFLEKQKEVMGERIFNTIYQQKPLDEEGAYFNIDKLIFHDEPYNSSYILRVRSWDLAYSDATKGEINDSTSGALMCKINDNTYALTDIQLGQYGDYLKQKLIDTARSDGQGTQILIESGTKGGASLHLFNEYKSYLQGYYCIQSEPIGSKVDRAFGLKQAILDGKIHIYLMNDEIRGKFIEQFMSFPFGRHDDIVDSVAYAYNYLESKTASRGIIGVGHIKPRRRIDGSLYYPKHRRVRL